MICIDTLCFQIGPVKNIDYYYQYDLRRELSKRIQDMRIQILPFQPKFQMNFGVFTISVYLQ